MINYSNMLRLKKDAINEHLSEPFQKVMVALSGGPDSTALFAAFYEFSKLEKNFQLAALHVNYGLRGEDSNGDEMFSRELAERFGVPFYLRQVSRKEKEARRGESLQEWARRLRYEEFERYAAQGWVIALAHHQDDLAENVLLRLARGAGPGKLVGMKEWQKPYWRPFLSQKKADLLVFLESRDLKYRQDASNDNDDYSRNAIRMHVLPELERLFPGAAGRIAACGKEAEDLFGWCDKQLELELPTQASAFSQYVSTLRPGVAAVALARWFRANLPQQRLTRSLLVKAKERVAKGLPPWPLPSESVATGAVRRAQHAGSWAATDKSLYLEPHASAYVGHQGGILRASSATNELMLEILCKPLQSMLRFKDQGRSWRLKTLLQLWQVPVPERASYQVVYENGLALGLFDGQRVCVPDDRGNRQEIPCLNISLRCW
jgi:tRNA(Ile)-lysidine synthase